jgi:hypothetical protein
MAKVWRCVVCMDRPAVIRITAVNADSEVLDTAYVCGNGKCLNQVGELLAPGQQQKPIIKGKE